MMPKKIATSVLFCCFFLSLVFQAKAQQDRQLGMSQQFRQAERIIRIAEPGELADTLNVWGDVNSAGRYLIPTTTNLPKLISYCFGPATLQNRETSLDWSKLRLEVKVSRYNSNNDVVEVETFNYKYNKPEPKEMFEFDLQNNDIVTVQVKRRPAFIDYVNVVAPVITSVASTILILDRIRN